MRCEQCQRPIQGPPVRTATRVLCQDCGDAFTGFAAGVLAGGTVGDGIATSGWVRALRRRRDDGRRDGDQPDRGPGDRGDHGGR